MPLGTKVCLGPGDIVLYGDPAPPEKEHSLHISVRVYCGQTAGWIKMPHGTKVGIGPGNIVLDGNPAPLPQMVTLPPPIFGPYLLWANGWMDQDATW